MKLEKSENGNVLALTDDDKIMAILPPDCFVTADAGGRDVFVRRDMSSRGYALNVESVRNVKYGMTDEAFSGTMSDLMRLLSVEFFKPDRLLIEVGGGLGS